MPAISRNIGYTGLMKLALFVGVLFIPLTTTADKTAGERVDDTTLHARVKTALAGDDFFGAMGINIEVRKGVVQLGGFVDDASEGRRAAEEAGGVEGVVKVDNQLHEKTPDRGAGQAIDDKVITSKVKGAISDAGIGTTFKVNVDTYNAVVLLTGFVDTSERKKTVGDSAASVDDAKTVINGVYVLD